MDPNLAKMFEEMMRSGGVNDPTGGMLFSLGMMNYLSKQSNPQDKPHLTTPEATKAMKEKLDLLSRVTTPYAKRLDILFEICSNYGFNSSPSFLGNGGIQLLVQLAVTEIPNESVDEEMHRRDKIGQDEMDERASMGSQATVYSIRRLAIGNLAEMTNYPDYAARMFKSNLVPGLYPVMTYWIKQNPTLRCKSRDCYFEQIPLFTIAKILNIGANLIRFANTKAEAQQLVTYIARPAMQIIEYIKEPNVLMNTGRMFHSLAKYITDPEDIKFFAANDIEKKMAILQDFFHPLNLKDFKRFSTPTASASSKSTPTLAPTPTSTAAATPTAPTPAPGTTATTTPGANTQKNRKKKEKKKRKKQQAAAAAAAATSTNQASSTTNSNTVTSATQDEPPSANYNFDSDSLIAEEKACHTCNTVGKVKRCAHCNSVRYCSRECQIKDWPTHKLVCKPESS